ncbi:Hypothetical protein GL50581_178 [Giardia duodenalis ATCC 50581]|nr:Hypothetical protein GL50581_178 [Giardia intestinalis ATCC 50581]
MAVVDASTTPRDSQQVIGAGELVMGLSNIFPDTDDDGDGLCLILNETRTVRIKCDINIVERHISRPARIKETCTGVFTLRLTPAFDPGHVSVKDLETFKACLRRLACNCLNIREEQIAVIRIGRRKCMTNLGHLRTNLSTYFRKVGRGQSVQFYKGLSLDVTIGQDDLAHQEIGMTSSYLSHSVPSHINSSQSILSQHNPLHINSYLQLSNLATRPHAADIQLASGGGNDESLPVASTCAITNLITRQYPNIRASSPSHLAEWVQQIAHYPPEQWPERVARGIPSTLIHHFYFQPIRPVDFKFRLLFMELPEEVFDEAYLYLQNLRQQSIQNILSRCPSEITAPLPVCETEPTE